jgi:hypothetical protein
VRGKATERKKSDETKKRSSKRRRLGAASPLQDELWSPASEKKETKRNRAMNCVVN